MTNLDMVPYAQDAVKGNRVLIAVIHPTTGRQVVNLECPAVPPFIEIRHDGFAWHDQAGHTWEKTDVWRHAAQCVCRQTRRNNR